MYLHVHVRPSGSYMYNCMFWLQWNVDILIYYYLLSVAELLPTQSSCCRLMCIGLKANVSTSSRVCTTADNCLTTIHTHTHTLSGYPVLWGMLACNVEDCDQITVRTNSHALPHLYHYLPASSISGEYDKVE